MLALAVPLLTGAREPPAYAELGRASWYGPGLHGRRTASGARFDQRALTAAHRGLPLGTRATVTNLVNGRSVKVEINDRGPYESDRTIDLSRAAAREIGLVGSGLAPVLVEVAAVAAAEAGGG